MLGVVLVTPGHLPEPCLLPSAPEEGASCPQGPSPEVLIRGLDPTVSNLKEYSFQVGMLFDIATLAFSNGQMELCKENLFFCPFDYIEITSLETN